MKYFPSNCKILRKSLGLTISQIADRLGLANSTWGGYETGSSTPNLKALYRISEIFGVPVPDLLEKDLQGGIGNTHLIEKLDNSKNGENAHLNTHPIAHPIRENQAKPIEYKQDLRITLAAEPGDLNDTKNVLVPITDLSVAAGGGVFNPEYIDNVESLRFPSRFFKKGLTYLVVRAKGDSMSPGIYDSDLIVIQLLERSEWARMRDEDVYVVVDTEGKAYLKRVKNRLKKGFIVLKSDSPDKASYPNFNLQEDEITMIWWAYINLSFKFPDVHGQYYNKVQALEDKYEDMEQRVRLMEGKLK